MSDLAIATTEHPFHTLASDLRRRSLPSACWRKTIASRFRPTSDKRSKSSPGIWDAKLTI